MYIYIYYIYVIYIIYIIYEYIILQIKDGFRLRILCIYPLQAITHLHGQFSRRIVITQTCQSHDERLVEYYQSVDSLYQRRHQSLDSLKMLYNMAVLKMPVKDSLDYKEETKRMIIYIQLFVFFLITESFQSYTCI